MLALTCPHSFEIGLPPFVASVKLPRMPAQLDESQNSTEADTPAFGTYAPAANTRLLRWMVKFGLSRGSFLKKVQKSWLSKHGSIVDSEIRGLRYRLNLSDNVTDSKILLSSKVYDGEELQFLAKVCHEGCFVDVGANVGYYTMSLLKAGYAQALPIEPNPPTLQRLDYNLKLNNFSDRVFVVPKGVGPEGELEFYQTGGLGGSSFVKPSGEVKSVKIQTLPLLDILRKHHIERIGGMKVDVEGFEDRVLIPFLQEAPDALLPRRIVMESCHQQQWAEDIRTQFTKRGYRLVGKTRANELFERKPE